MSALCALGIESCHQALLRFFLFHGLMDSSMSHHRLYCARKPASIHVPCLFAIGIPNNNEHGIWSESILFGENPSIPWAIERSTCRRRSSEVCTAPFLRQRYGLSPEDQKDLTRSLVVELNPDTRTNVSVYAACICHEIMQK